MSGTIVHDLLRRLEEIEGSYRALEAGGATRLPVAEVLRDLAELRGSEPGEDAA